jgi:hypothetical protein
MELASSTLRPTNPTREYQSCLDLTDIAGHSLARPLRTVALCWQFQPDAGAPERDYPDLGYTEALGERRRVGSEVLGGLAWQQVDLYPPGRSGVGRDHSGDVQRVAAGDGVLGATEPRFHEAVLHAPDEELVRRLSFVSHPCGRQPAPPGTSL